MGWIKDILTRENYGKGICPMFRKKELDHEQRLAKEMFEKMTRKEKTRYILQYYGLHIFVTIALIIGIVVYIAEYRENEKRKDWLCLVTPGAYSYDIQAAAELLLQQSQWPEGLNYPVFVDDDVEAGVGNMQLVAYLTNDEVDFLVCDEVTLMLLKEDDTLTFDAVELEQTAFGEMVEFRRKLFLLTFYDTARYDKVMEFRPILVPAEDAGQSAQIQP